MFITKREILQKKRNASERDTLCDCVLGFIWKKWNRSGTHVDHIFHGTRGLPVFDGTDRALFYGTELYMPCYRETQHRDRDIKTETQGTHQTKTEEASPNVIKLATRPLSPAARVIKKPK